MALSYELIDCPSNTNPLGFLTNSVNFQFFFFFSLMRISGKDFNESISIPFPSKFLSTIVSILLSTIRKLFHLFLDPENVGKPDEYESRILLIISDVVKLLSSLSLGFKIIFV